MVRHRVSLVIYTLSGNAGKLYEGEISLWNPYMSSPLTHPLDPNRVSSNSDLDRPRRLMTRMADAAGNKDEVGCGETIKVTWHLVKQAWCYFNMKTKLAGIGARLHGDVISGKD